MNLLHTLANVSGCVVVLTGDYHYSDLKVIQPGSEHAYADALHTGRLSKPVYQVCVVCQCLPQITCIVHPAAADNMPVCSKDRHARSTCTTTVITSHVLLGLHLFWSPRLQPDSYSYKVIGCCALPALHLHAGNGQWYDLLNSRAQGAAL